MKHRRTRLYGAVLVVLALMGLVGAASASATVFETPGTGPLSSTTWNGAVTQPKGAKLNFREGTGFLGTVMECPESTLSGNAKGENPSELTATPTLACWRVNHNVGQWNTNGCQFRLHTSGTFDIVNCVSPMTWSVGICTWSIGNQTGLASVTYSSSESEGLKNVTVNAALTKISYTTTGSGECTPGSYSDGELHGSWVLKPAHFRAESFPAYVSAAGSGKMFSFPGENVANLSCEWSGTGELSAASPEALVLGVTKFNNCMAGGVLVTPTMGGCKLRYTASGNFQVAGAGACTASPIKFTANLEVGGACTIEIGPSGQLAGFGFAGEGSGSARRLNLTGGPASGFGYTASGAGCTASGKFTNGEKKLGAMRLTATTASEGHGLPNGIWIE